jgi:peptide/nickel transport system substrate-binding protein
MRGLTEFPASKIRGGIASLLVLAFVAGCAPGAATGRGTGGGLSPEHRAPKVLTIGIGSEPITLNAAYGGGARGASSVVDIVNNSLMVELAPYVWVPQLAVEGISTEKGTWRLNADGTMDTIWRVHPNVRWQDGRPFTADDLAFSFQVYKDPEIPNALGIPIKHMQSAVATDPQTLVVHWSQAFVTADQAPGLIPMPRHLLEPLYQTDKSSFITSPYLVSEFVGVGPYRLTRWEPGSSLELSRHDGYFRGVPPLDTVIVRVLGDTQSLVVHLLGGGVDAALALDIDTAVEVKDRWEGAGHTFIASPSEKMRLLESQFRPEFARPSNGMTNLLVRQALYHAIDRPALAAASSNGLSPVADSWMLAAHDLRAEVESAIPQFPHDLRRAQALLAEAGWTRGPDGILVYPPTGERFEFQLTAEVAPLSQLALNIVADDWKRVGVQTQTWQMSDALRNDREVRAKLPGGSFRSQDGEIFYIDRLHSRNIAAPETRWFGVNGMAYANPKVDALLDRLSVAIARDQQILLHRELLREQMGDVAVMPLYWKIDPILVVKGVTGVRGRYTSNIYEWDKS